MNGFYMKTSSVFMPLCNTLKKNYKDLSQNVTRLQYGENKSGLNIFVVCRL